MTFKPSDILLWPMLFFLAVLSVSCATPSKRPAELTDGKLAPCPDKPNCVSSEEDPGSHYVEPLIYTDPPEAAWKRLKRVVQEMGGLIERESQNGMRASFKTRVFRFVDEMAFRMDAARQRIHVRSASRVGYLDFGVNRRRVEALRLRFTQARDQLAQPPSEPHQ